MQPPPDSPLDAAVCAHALARGLATPAQLDQARRRRATFAAAGQQIDLLAALGPSLPPPHVAELRAFAASSGRAATPPGGIPRPTPAAGIPAVGAATLAPGPAPQPPPQQQPQVPFGSHPSPQGPPAPGRTPPAGIPRRVALPGGALGPGDPVGPYVIVKELARGGMGAVYVAEQPGAGRRVALKVRLGGDARGAERFFIEGRAAAKLRHPGVVQVHDVGTDERGRQYLAMDLVEGQSLEQRVNKEGPLPDAEVARIGLALAQALASAHAEGILHRDLKPANVLQRAHDGAALLTDFGLAKQVQGAEALTRTGDVLGTPNYMPPEQANGRPADTRSDVYGLGATLWHLQIGRAPFEGGSVVAVLAAVLKGEVVRPTTCRPELSPALEAVVLRCMAKHPAARYQAMTEVAADLQRFLTDGTTLALSDERHDRSRRRTRSGLLAGGALLGLVAMVAVAIRVRQELAARDAAALATGAPAPTAPATEPAPATEEEAPPPPPPPASEAPPPTMEADFVTGQAWVPVRTLLEAPAPRWGCGMVYDARRRVVVLFGGTDGRTAFDDTWTFDGAAWTRESPSRKPPGRYAFAMAWDAARGRTVVHGGALAKPRPTPPPQTDGTTAPPEPIIPDFDDVWEWDGARWSEASPKTGGGPGARAFHAAAFDPKRSRCVLFGGPDSTGTLSADLWGWDGSWTALPAGPAPGPSGRQLSGVAWDAANDRLVVVGGAGFPAADELWSWRPDRGWTKAAIAPLPGGPGPRQQPLVVAAGPDLLVHGGSHGARRFVDTWALVGDALILRVPDLGQGLMPPPRKWQAAAWDAGRGEVVLFGGHPPVREPPVSTWVFRPR